MDVAGWKAVKEGGKLYKNGAVSAVALKDSLVRGKVRVGRKTLAAGLKVHSATDIDNLCQCPESRRDGTICAHSVAVSLAAEEQQKAPKEETQAPELLEKKGNDATQHPLINITLEKVFFELWKKDRLPIRISEVDTAFAKDNPKDRRQSEQIRAWLSDHCQTPPQGLPPFLVLNRRQAGELLKLLAGYNNFRIDKNEEKLLISDQSIRLKLHLENSDIPGELRMTLPGFSDGGQKLLPQDEPDITPWIYSRERGQLWPVRIPDNRSHLKKAHDLLASTEKGLTVSEIWLASAIEEWSDVFEIEAESDVHLPSLGPGQPEFELHMEGSLNHISATIHAYYGKHEIILGMDEDDSPDDFFPYQVPIQAEGDARMRYFTRNSQAEKTALHELTGAGFATPDQQGLLHLRGNNEVMYFHASVVPLLRSKWRAVHFGERYRERSQAIQTVRPTVEFSSSSSGEDWFSCHFEFTDSDRQTSLSEGEVRRLLATGQNQVKKLDDGSLFILDRDACDDWFEVLRDCNLQQEAGQFQIPNAQRGYVESSLALYQSSKAADPYDPCNHGLPNDALAECLGDLNLTLRPYQKKGIAWLYHKLLPKNGGGAVLADEMGLGKTLQTLAVSKLLKQSSSSQEETSPILVICPTSLIDNWAQECRKFVPEFKVLTMRGQKRSENFKNFRFADLVITSYALIIRDIDRYAEMHFSLVVLDEASYIRNPKTRNARSVKRLNSDSRLALTGTPVENSVLDIWSISDFVCPGYLGGREEFKERYEQPINSGKASVQVHQRFRRRLEPLILRRTKRKVATDLPEKLEEIVYCSLTHTQKDYYEAILRETRNKITQAYSSGDKRSARMNMLTALLRLRQICCDCRLLESSKSSKNDRTPRSKTKLPDSAKIELLKQLLQESVEGGHRVLVFSQFVSMLNLIREELEESGIAGEEIAYLDGSSQDRAAQVDRFQANPSISVFLISLKAGGYGLNLTGADTVIHFDPWWNPAVENQATDRAHRIGQDKVVTSYKFITRDTVEEKILKLQRRKKDIFDAAIDDERPMMRGLNTEDLREILDV